MVTATARDGWMPDRLLAKQLHKRFGALSLEQHLVDTEQAAIAIFDSSQRAAANYLRFFRLERERHFERFMVSLRVAALFHDIGKANEHFFAMVAKTSTDAQAVRHEHFSALVLCLPAIRDWLQASPLVDYDAVVGAVLSHHIKAAPPGSDRWAWCQPSRRGAVRLFLAHPEIKSTFARIAQVAGISAAPDLAVSRWDAEAPEWQQVLEAADDRADALSTSWSKSARSSAVDESRKMALAVKAALIAADGVASASFREGLSIAGWVRGALHAPALTKHEVFEKVIDPRIASLQRRGRWKVWQQFQLGAGELPSRTLLLAACGAGKTLAAWRWIATQCERHSVGRAIFLYPTRGTATEGFRDYVGWAPESEAALVSGTADYEIEQMKSNPSEATKDKDFALDESMQRLFALGLWSKRFFSATVDQFFSFVEHGYSSLCLLPVLADSVVVIDEVHSYDPRMFENTLSILREFDVPVLAMTATLPPSRRAQLEQLKVVSYPRDEDRVLLADLDAEEKHPRYDVSFVDSRDRAMERCTAALARDQRVLWVVNTVAQAQYLATVLQERLGSELLCYHSRFKLGDRQTIHGKTIELFKNAAGRCLAITTQVCEMSLDLDTDLLISEIAPWSSLVQRMGRANRDRRRRGDAFRASVVLYQPDRINPYTKEQMQSALEAVRALEAVPGGVSQKRLAELLERYAPQEAMAVGSAAFLTSGWYAVPGSLREEDDFARQCVLDEEIPELLARKKRRDPIDDLLLPVPKSNVIDLGDARPAELPPWLGVARATQYSRTLGFVASTGSRED